MMRFQNDVVIIRGEITHKYKHAVDVNSVLLYPVWFILLPEKKQDTPAKKCYSHLNESA